MWKWIKDQYFFNASTNSRNLFSNISYFVNVRVSFFSMFSLGFQIENWILQNSQYDLFHLWGLDGNQQQNNISHNDYIDYVSIDVKAQYNVIVFINYFKDLFNLLVT